MRIKSKVTLLLIVISLFFANILPHASGASDIPYAFWKLSEQYAQALEANDHQNIIRYGLQIVDLFKDNEDSQTALNIVTPRLEQIAKAYEAIGDYDKAVETFKAYIPKAQKQGWDEGVTYAQSKIQALSFDIQLYTTAVNTSANVFYGAKHEPRAGIYFGSTYDRDARISTYKWDKVEDYFPKKNAAYLVYADWGEKVSEYDRYFQDAKRNGMGVQLAWNTYDSKTMRNIKQDEQYIRTTANYLNKLNIPIFLRFACEMNIGENGDDPKAYIAAFRYVSTIMKETAPNVAMVWSPNEINAAGRTFEQYYPGDQYVDWVGLSVYTFRYFQGKKDWGDAQDTIDSVYFTGDYANSLAKIKPFMEQYGIKKPVMLSETGVEHYAKLEKEDLTEWAKVQMKRLYIYGPMIYPQLKGIYYFNVDGDKLTPYSDYALYHNETMHQLYNQLVDNDYYVSKIGSSAPFCYEKIDEDTFDSHRLGLMTYTIVPKVLKPTVQYKIDGGTVATRDKIPYDVELDFGTLSEGMHTFTVEVYDGNQKMRSKNYHVEVGPKNVRIVSSQSTGDGKFVPVKERLKNAVLLYIGSPKAYVGDRETLVDTDNSEVKPFITEGRTLVPVRFISEKLGAAVAWDGATSTVTVTLEEQTVRLVLGSSKMLVNDQEVLLDVPAASINGRTFIPLRALTEALGKKVFFDRDLIIISDWENIIDKTAEKEVIDSLIEQFK